MWRRTGIDLLLVILPAMCEALYSGGKWIYSICRCVMVVAGYQ